MSREENRPQSFWSGDLPMLALAIALALLVRTFVFQTFYVPSSSMYPTLLIGDHVLVNKFIYGPRLPVLGWRVPMWREPKRGEIVVFRLARGPGHRIYPVDQSPDLPVDNFVKRLIGLPGDTVAYHNERLILNGEAVPMQETGQTFRDEEGRLLNVRVETLGSCRHLVLDDPRVRTPDMKEIRIAPGRYLFMGDNRDNSLDGRRAGTVRLAELAGPASLNYWSWDWNGSWFALLNPLTWFDNLTDKMRWERMGKNPDCLDPGESPTEWLAPAGR